MSFVLLQIKMLTLDKVCVIRLLGARSQLKKRWSHVDFVAIKTCFNWVIYRIGSSGWNCKTFYITFVDGFPNINHLQLMIKWLTKGLIMENVTNKMRPHKPFLDMEKGWPRSYGLKLTHEFTGFAYYDWSF